MFNVSSESTWILGCEWVVAEALYTQTEEVFFEKESICYNSFPQNITNDELIVGNFLNILSITNRSSELSSLSTASTLDKQFFKYLTEDSEFKELQDLRKNKAELYIFDETHIKEQVLFAINSKSEEDLSYLVEQYGQDKIQSLDKEGHFLARAYHLQALDIAEFLLNKVKVAFHLRNLVQTTPLNSLQSMLQHVERIKSLNQDQRIKAKSLVSTVYSATPHFLSIYNYSHPCDIFTNYIQTDDLTFAEEENIKCRQYIDYQPVRDVVSHVAQYLIKSKGLLKIYVTKENGGDSLFGPSDIRYPFHFPHLFVSALNYSISSHLIHEATHFVFNNLFHYRNNPYKYVDYKQNTTRYQSYLMALNSFVDAFSRLILSEKYKKDLKKLQNSKIALMAEAWFHEKYGNQKRVEKIIKILKMKDINVIKKKLLALWGIHTEEIVYFIHRVYEWAGRPESRLHSELLNRLPEIYSRNPKSALVREVLKPLEVYWQTYITPLTQKHLNYTQTSFKVKITVENESTSSISWLSLPVAIISSIVFITWILGHLKKRHAGKLKKIDTM